ncbi:MAG TPA: nucleotidyltransferase family protein [Gammaproteobacteria bacterium]|nr:nucleotidyltransferase family protein [Gammaproteobacteria bacterium]
MPNYSRSLIHWCECLQGRVPKHVDWVSLLGLANETLTTPALKEFATRFKDQIPEDVYFYIREMFERNVVRNDRLAAQLAEAVAAINDRGVTPVLLKGAAMLATAPRANHGFRLMSDLDILVSPDEVESTLDALLARSYTVHYQTPPDWAGNWHMDLQRPIDVGMIDLHRAPPGPAFFYRQLGDVKQHCKIAHIGKGSAYIPSATYQALILTIHDQFQDSDYWTGNIDMRHLLELRDLAQSPEGIDWNLLASFTPNKLARNALETHLVALFYLFEVDVPARMRNRFIPRIQHWRRLAQARLPFLRQALLPIALLDYRNYREGLGASNKEGNVVGQRKRALPKSDTLGWLLWLSRERRTGKV